VAFQTFRTQNPPSITGGGILRSCTIQVSAALLMNGWLCRSVPYMDRDVIWGAGARGPPLILKISDFLCFCTHNFVFFIFCPPPLGSRSKLCPPLEKAEMTSLYMESAPLHNARKISASEVYYSPEALYQMLYTLIFLHYTCL